VNESDDLQTEIDEDVESETPQHLNKELEEPIRLIDALNAMAEHRK